MFGRTALINYVKNSNYEIDVKIKLLREAAKADWESFQSLHSEQKEYWLDEWKSATNEAAEFKKEHELQKRKFTDLLQTFTRLKKEFAHEEIVKKFEMWINEEKPSYPQNPLEEIEETDDVHVGTIFLKLARYNLVCQTSDMICDIKGLEKLNTLLEKTNTTLIKLHQEKQAKESISTKLRR